jgi:hypothetical protein
MGLEASPEGLLLTEIELELRSDLRDDTFPTSVGKLNIGFFSFQGEFYPEGVREKLKARSSGRISRLKALTRTSVAKLGRFFDF